MGHEFAGEVVAVGSAVRTHRVGDIVMSPFTISCGVCYYCRIGLTARCIHSQLFGWVEKGKGLHGGQAELVRVPQADGTLIKLPEGVSLTEGLLLGDILSTGFFCARQAGIHHDGTYVVVGCGPVGLMAILGAREAGAERVFAVDDLPERLQMARHFGAMPLNRRDTSFKARILDATEGRGADAVLEAVGSGPAVRLAVDLVRPGGTVSSVGVCTDAHMAFSPVEAYNKNLTYKIGRCPARHMMEELIPMVQQKKYDITAVFSHTLSLEQGVHGYDLFANKKDNCLKVLLQPI